MEEPGTEQAERTNASQQINSTIEKVAAKTVNTAISAATAGALFGSMILPGVGTIVGSILGAFIGGIAKERSLERESASKDVSDQINLLEKINSLPDLQKKALLRQLMLRATSQTDEVKEK